MKRGFAIAMALGMAASTQVLAQQPNSNTNLSWNYVSAGVFTGEIGDLDFTGLGLGGSLALNDQIYMQGGYSTAESDDSFGVGNARDDIDLDTWRLGLGFHTPVNQTTDGFVSLSYVDNDVNFAGFSEDGSGNILEAGLRGRNSQELEWNASIFRSDIEDNDEIGLQVGARYFLQPNTSLGLNYQTADDTDLLALDLRLDL